MLSQLTLSLNTKTTVTFDDFHAGPNFEVVTQLKNTAHGQGEKMLYLYGAVDSGRSHLLQAACDEAHQKQHTAVYLPLTSLVSLTPDVLLELEKLTLICIDDLETIAGQAPWEEAIFHLYNRVCDHAGSMVIASRFSPAALPIQLPDLKSRLAHSVVYALQTLSDDDKRIILYLHAKRRGIHLTEEVGQYLLRHYPRQLSALLAALETLDQASLAAKRNITIPFVKTVLESMTT